MNDTELFNTPKIKAVGYCRFSSDMQREESIDAQKRFISLFASQNSYEIIGFYVDRAKSGKNMNRPGMQKMLADSKNDDFQAIIVHKLDRFSRNTADTLETFELLKERNVEVISAYERLENSPSGNLMLTILSGMGEYYARNLSNEVLKGQKENAYKGLSNGGKGCLGYNIVDQKYVINEKEAESVRIIFNMYADGNGYNSIIDRLNFLGYVTKAGKPFGKNSLYEILNNEKYIGIYTFNKIAKCSFRGKRNAHKMKPDSEIIRVEGGVPAIISKSVWDRVQSIRHINPNGKSHCKHFYLLSGLIYCGECGCKLHGNPRKTGNGGPDYITYRCNHKGNNHSCTCKEVRREYVESFVIEELINHFFNPDVVPVITKQLNDSLRKKAEESSGEYKQYKETLKMLKNSKENLLQAIKTGGYNKSISEELNDVEAQMERCNERIEEVKRKMSDFPQFTEEQILNQVPQFKEFAKRAEREEIRSMIQQYVEKVTVYNEKIEVTFKVAFSLAQKKEVLYRFNTYIFRNALERRGKQNHLLSEFQSLAKKLHSA